MSKYTTFIAKCFGVAAFFSPMTAFAQQTTAEMVAMADAALQNEDIVLSRRIVARIDSNDIASLPDSTAFDYYWVCGNLAYEDDRYDELIDYLVKARRLCEGSYGIHQVVYLQVMSALADAYEELGRLDEAMEVCQEGIVKGWNVGSYGNFKEPFGELYSSLASLYEKKGWYKEVPVLWYSAWNNWDKTYEPFEAANLHPLYMLQVFYTNRGEYDEALKVNDKMTALTAEMVDRMHPVWCDILFYRGVIYGHQGDYRKAVETYSEGLHIARHNALHDENYELLFGNRLVSMAEFSERSEMDAALEEAKREVPNRYIQYLYNVGKTFHKRRMYDDAISYMSLAAQLAEGEEREVCEQRCADFAEAKERHQQLERVLQRPVPPKGSSEWWMLKGDVAEAYYADDQPERARDVLTEIVEEAYRSHLPQEERMEWVDLLMSCAMNVGDYACVLRYSSDWMEYGKKHYGERSAEYYNSQNATAVACIKTGDLKQAEEVLRRCTALCIALYGEDSENQAIQLHNTGRVAQLQGDLVRAKGLYEQALDVMERADVPEGRRARTRQYLGEVEHSLKEQL